MTDLINHTLNNRYQITQLLGQGGMGAVYKGKDITLDRWVAVKVMHGHLSNADFGQRFLQEARAAAKLNHPSIIKVHDFGQANNLLFIVMEFIEGGNLAEMLRSLRDKQQWIALPEALDLLRQIALALDYAHRQGILHRDIKPANIMLRNEMAGAIDYQPVITDLGLAKLREGGMETQIGSSMGTPAYMSPEQAIGATTDARSDVYSLGVLLYELALGQRPFPISTLTEAERYHGKEPPPAPNSIRPDIPATIAAIILKALEKKPANRYQSAAELAQALAQIPTETVIATAPPLAKAGVARLMTQYQESMLQQRGASILDEFPSLPGGSGQIQLLTPDGKARSIALSTASATVGRDGKNQIVIEDEKASRQHARIEFDGKQWKVTDLNSRNGTYLGQSKLLPGVPEIWNETKPLQIGSHYLRLVADEALPKSQVSTQIYQSQIAKPTQVTAPQVTTPAVVDDIALFTTVEQLEIEAGGFATIPVLLINRSNQVKHFSVVATDQAGGWTQPSSAMQLMPNEQSSLQLTIRPPRSSNVRAGDYRLTLAISHQDRPSPVAIKTIFVKLLPYYLFQSELRPQEGRVGQPMKVSLTNQGNAAHSYRMRWSDRADELLFERATPEVKVEAGGNTLVEFLPKVRRRRMIGGEKQHPITVQVEPSNGAPATHNAIVISRGVVPPWLPPLLAVALVALAGFAGYIIQQRNQANRDANATTVASVLTSDGNNNGLNDKVNPAPGTSPTHTPIPPPTRLPPTPVPPTVAPISIATTPAVPTQPVADFTGTWFTNFAEVHLSQSGDQVSGQYQWYGNSKWWTLSGTVNDKTLTGQYKVSPVIGQFVFVMDTSVRAFDGYWINQSSGGHIHWCGVQSGSLPDGCGFSGSWLAKSNDLPFQWQPSMNMRQEGDAVVGTFDNGNPNETGTISGRIGTFGRAPHYTLVGSYRLDADGFSNSARWTLQNSDDRQFVGCSISFGKVRDWLGWREGENEPASDHPQACP